MEENVKEAMPKKSVMITLGFAIQDDTEGLAVKQVIDDAVKEIEKKRYSFQIIEV